MEVFVVGQIHLKKNKEPKKIPLTATPWFRVLIACRVVFTFSANLEQWTYLLDKKESLITLSVHYN